MTITNYGELKQLLAYGLWIEMQGAGAGVEASASFELLLVKDDD